MLLHTDTEKHTPRGKWGTGHKGRREKGRAGMSLSPGGAAEEATRQRCARPVRPIQEGDTAGTRPKDPPREAGPEEATVKPLTTVQNHRTTLKKHGKFFCAILPHDRRLNTCPWKLQLPENTAETSTTRQPSLGGQDTGNHFLPSTFPFSKYSRITTCALCNMIRENITF